MCMAPLWYYLPTYDAFLVIGAQQLDLPGNVITIDGEMGLVFLIDGTVCLLQ